MRLSWNEIRVRAASFADDWRGAAYEKGETQSFYNDFFEIFGVKRRSVARYEEHVKKLDNSSGYIDLFWPGVLLVEQKSVGRSLETAAEQAGTYFDALKEHEKPRYQLLSDFQTFELLDCDEGEIAKFALTDLPDHIERFGFILGVQKRTFRDQPEINIRASYIMGELHDALKDSGYTGHELERYLVRLLFCMFADDTGIFEPKDIMLDIIEQRTAEDGSDTAQWISHLFQVLNTPEDRRQVTLDEDLARFPYVNGDLFAEPLKIAAFDSRMRQLLIRACEFKWEAISPAIFGALFQSVMDEKERRKTGGHYTTERNIMKVIGPLFLDDLVAEFEFIKARKRDRIRLLREFHEKLANMRFFDPACGCGNFLVIAYRALRELELEILRELHTDGQLDLLAEQLSRIDVDQFYGIELLEFPARIAETALWMMDHIMNNRLSLEFGKVFVRIPLTTSPNILPADALDSNWAQFLSPKECTVILGNPPFIGSKYQSDVQREQTKRIAKLGGSGGTLDYVTAWFFKAGEYIAVNPQCRIGYVATNSITQGEQVAQLWPALFDRYGLELDFGHRTFSWDSDARGKAHVHVVILGLSHKTNERPEKRLFTYPDIQGDPVESTHKALTAYLFGANDLGNRHLVVEERSMPLCSVPASRIGSKPIDGGYYIFSPVEKDALLTEEPGAEPLIHPYVGSDEFVNGEVRYILALQDASPGFLRGMPKIIECIENVARYRRGEIPSRMDVARGKTEVKKRGRGTVKMAETPRTYHVTVIPDRPFLALPEAGSERREYLPIGWLEPPTIPSNLLKVILSDDRWHFGILISKMHFAWLKHIGGKLKSDPRYSSGIVYNTFPWPEASEQKRNKIRELASEVLVARSKHKNATLADLYDPNTMPLDLRKSHQALDGAVDRLYRRVQFADDQARVEHLFGLYESLVSAN